MTIEMGISAASVAVTANNNTLVNVGTMQASFFELDASTINSSLEASVTQANADQASIMDQANASQDQAIGEFAGSITGIAMTGGGLIAGSILNSQATKTQPPTELNVLGEQVPGKTPAPATAPADPAQEIPSATILAKSTEPAISSSPPEESATVFGTTSAASDAEATQAKEALSGQIAKEQTKQAQTASDNTAAQEKEIRGRGDLFLQNANTFGTLFNGVGTSAGKMASYNAQVDQGQQSKIKDLEASLSSVLNTEAGLIGSQISNLDQTRSAAYQLMGSLQARQG